MVKPIGYPTDSIHNYQQALSDFGITELMEKLSNFSDADFDASSMNLEQQELESLAAILIGGLAASLNGKAIASYLNGIRHGSTDISLNLFHPALRKISAKIPKTFPFVNPPRFLYGDKLRWIPDGDKTDWGIAIGRFYSFAPHLCNWAWCYLIWLDCLSPSYAWTVADTAWEDDLERMEEAA